MALHLPTDLHAVMEIGSFYYALLFVTYFSTRYLWVWSKKALELIDLALFFTSPLTLKNLFHIGKTQFSKGKMKIRIVATSYICCIKAYKICNTDIE